jgi:hypothetical protein
MTILNSSDKKRVEGMAKKLSREDVFFSKKEIQDLLQISDDLSSASLSTPFIHNHLNVILLELGKQLNRKNREKEKLFRKKYEYYSGKAPPEVYKEKPFPLKVLKTDLHIYLSSDEELSELTEEIEDLKVDIKFIEECLRACNQRSFQIKEAINFKKFMAGEM